MILFESSDPRRRWKRGILLSIERKYCTIRVGELIVRRRRDRCFMPDQELSHRLQKAVLWEKTGVDRYARPILGSPVELEVRWNNKRREVVDSKGSTVAVDATVHVDREVEIGSAMWYGAIADLPGTAGVPEADVMYVVTCDVVLDVKARAAHTELTLSRDQDRAV